jgi:hypothetical protein
VTEIIQQDLASAHLLIWVVDSAWMHSATQVKACNLVSSNTSINSFPKRNACATLNMFGSILNAQGMRVFIYNILISSESHASNKLLIHHSSIMSAFQNHEVFSRCISVPFYRVPSSWDRKWLSDGIHCTRSKESLERLEDHQLMRRRNAWHICACKWFTQKSSTDLEINSIFSCDLFFLFHDTK